MDRVKKTFKKHSFYQNILDKSYLGFINLLFQYMLVTDHIFAVMVKYLFDNIESRCVYTCVNIDWNSY